MSSTESGSLVVSTETNVNRRNTSARTIIQRAAPFCLLALACFGAYRFARSFQKDTPLIIAADKLDFGEVWQTDSFDWKLPLENRTDRDIEVLGFFYSCPCVSVEPNRLTIPPRQVVDVRMRLDLTAVNEQDRDKALRDFAVRLVPQLPSSLISDGWDITGRVRSAFTLSSDTVSFVGGKALTIGLPMSSETVGIRAHEDLETILIHHDRSYAKVLLEKLGPSRFDLKISPNMSLSEGDFRFKIVLRPQLACHEDVPPITLPVFGRVLGQIQAFPAQIDLGPRVVGESTVESVVVQCKLGKSFDVLGIEGECDHLRLDEHRVDSSRGKRLFALTYRCVRPGYQSRVVRFALRNSEGKTSILTVPLTAYGLTSPNQELRIR